MATLLVVEDERLIGEDLVRRLRRFGHTVFGPITTGEQAVEQASTLKPDLIFMDIVLRGAIDGVEAARQIQQSMSARLIYLSAYADPVTRQRASLTNPKGYLVKPFEAAELRETLDSALADL